MFILLVSMNNCNFLVPQKVKVYMGEGWYYDFHRTHFDAFSPPDFYARVSTLIFPFPSPKFFGVIKLLYCTVLIFTSLNLF